MPGTDKFGDKTTWLKGKLGHPGTGYTYVDLYKCESIRQENTNDYMLILNGREVELLNCQVVDDLEEIKPPGA